MPEDATSRRRTPQINRTASFVLEDAREYFLYVGLTAAGWAIRRWCVSRDLEATTTIPEMSELFLIAVACVRAERHARGVSVPSRLTDHLVLPTEASAVDFMLEVVEHLRLLQRRRQEVRGAQAS